MGFFSWKTTDTDKSVSNTYSSRGTFPVAMVGLDEGGNRVIYDEDDYEGYGEFGGKDYYELLAEMNPEVVKFFEEKRGGFINKELRSKGITIAFDKEYNKPLLWPHIVEDEDYEVDFRSEPESCDEQGYFYDDEDGDPEDFDEW